MTVISKNPLTLEKQLTILEEKEKAQRKKADAINAEVAQIRKKIQDKKDKNKPKEITDIVKTMKDVLRIGKPTKEELVVINYSGKSDILKFGRDMAVLALISKVLNEGWKPKMDGAEERHYPWHYINSSGFVFAYTCYDLDCARTSSASRLCLKNEKLAIHAGKVFLQQYKTAIMG